MTDYVADTPRNQQEEEEKEEMIRHLLRTRYRIVHDTVTNSYRVDYREWWGWWRTVDRGFISEQFARECLDTCVRRRQLVNRLCRFKTTYKC